jgi:protein ImuA
MLHGGLRRDALHEIRSATTRDAAAATGFAVALLAGLSASDNRPLLWIVETDAAREGGDPYGVGLAGFGFDPRRLVVVRVKRPVDALWVFEEGLACRGLAGVLAEIRGNPRLLDLTASRRLALRAAAGGTGLLLRQAGEPESGAALTRWLVAPLPAGTTGDYTAGIGRPAWRLTLERNRNGQTGTIDVEWNHERRAFAIASARSVFPAHSRPLPPLSPDRPPSPADAGKIVALPVPARQEFPLPREIQRRHARSRG